MEDYFSVTRDFQLIKNKTVFSLNEVSILQALNKLLNKDFSPKNIWLHIEHTSSNPTSNIHIANLINGLLGDIFCRLTNTESSFFVNDCGRQFFKLLAQIKTSSIDEFKKEFGSFYSTKMVEESLIEQIRTEVLKKGSLNTEQKEIRDFALEKICNSLSKCNIKIKNFYYESDYYLAALNWITQKRKIQPWPEGIVINGVRLTTSNFTPLYTLTDYLYRKDLNSKLKGKKLIVLGPGNLKSNQELNSLIPIEDQRWSCLGYPVIRNEGKKISKRENLLLDYENLITLVKKELKIEDLETRNLLKFWILNNTNNPFLDFNNLLKDEKTLKYFLKVLASKPVSALKSEGGIFELIKSNKDSLLLQLWAQLPLILNKIAENKDLNRLVKLFERFYNLKKKETNPLVLELHNVLLNKLKTHLGFY